VKKNIPYWLLISGLIYILLFMLVFIYGDAKLALLLNPSTGTINDNYLAFFLMIYTRSLFYIGGLIIFATLLSLIIPRLNKFKPLLLGLSLSLTLTHLLVGGLKIIFNRPRPFQVLGQINNFAVAPPTDASLPSSHSADSMALATSLGLKIKKRWWAILLVLTLLMAYTRLYLGFHFLSDIIVGGLIGLLVGYFSNLLMETLYEKKLMKPLVEWIIFLVIALIWVGIYFLF